MASGTGGNTRIRLEPADEYLHPLEAATNFNESMYFNVFDPGAGASAGGPGGVGGWFRLANRPNEGKGEMSCCVYLPDGRIGFMFARPVRHDNDAFDGAGMRFTVEEPFKRLNLRYEGDLCVLENPMEMLDPGTAFKNNPRLPSRVELAFTGVSPMFGGEPVNADGSAIEQKAEESFARGHYEQHMAGTGEIQVGSERFAIDGLGLRDHSWGPRFWQSLYWYRWLPMSFTRDFAMMVSIVCRRPGEVHVGGMVLRDGEYVLIRDASLHTEYDGNDCQRRFRVTAETDERTYEVEGEVMSLIPLRNRRRSPEGETLVTRITEGMTRYRCDGLTGYGLSEYLDQMVDDQPAGKMSA